MSINKVILSGRLTADAVTKQTPNNHTVTHFTLAINNGKDKEGNDRKADFPTCYVWNASPKFVEKYLKKGRKVLIEGSIKTRTYNKDDEKRYVTEVGVYKIEYADNKPPEETTQFGPEIQEEDIPF